MRGKIARILMVMSLAAATGGCFQPLYGDRSVSAASGTDMAEKLSGVSVQQIPASNGTPESRIAVELRNDLLFALTGGSSPGYPTHELRIKISSTRLSVIVDVNTARPDLENYGLNATYDLIDMKTGKSVMKGQTFSRVSYDIPGQQQRFARARGLRDAENRATQVLADNIRNRLASFFVAGT
jgi:LPS-assembly lipoprotein